MNKRQIYFSQNIKRIFLLYMIFLKRIRLNGYLGIARFMLKRYIMRKKLPMAAMVALTYRCQCNCVHCSVTQLNNLNSPELSTDEIKKIIDNVAKIGMLKIGFTGGEPLLRGDILDLVDYAYKRGLSTSIDTNGILLSDEMVSNLKDAGITNINVSIDHPNQVYHDRLRKMEGCFNKAVSGIMNCVKAKVPCVVSTYLTNRAFEKGEIVGIINLSKKLKATAVRVIFPVYSGKLFGRKKALLSDLNKHIFFNSLLDGAFVYSESPLFDYFTRRIECSSEKKLSVYITAYGDIKYCYVSSDSLGNIRETPLITILDKSFYFNSSKKVKLGCLSCPDILQA